jgi:hypothetical protein
MRPIIKISIVVTGVLAVAAIFGLLSFYCIQTGHEEWAQVYLNTAVGIVILAILAPMGMLLLRRTRIRNGRVSFG